MAAVGTKSGLPATNRYCGCFSTDPIWFFQEKGVDTNPKGQVDIVKRLIRFGFIIIVIIFVNIMVIAVVITRLGCDVDTRLGSSFSAILVRMPW